MYRIRSASGNEVSYNSLEEFSAAVRRGEVHPEDEIFHTRANRWLDVKSHPHYRSATTWANHEPTAAATAPRAPVAPAQPVRQAQAPAAAPNNTTSKAQVFERPVIRTAPQTTVRPQLQAAPAAPAPVEPAPTPAKTEARAVVQPRTKDLSFIDLGDAPKAKAAAPVEPEAPAPPPKLELRHLPKLEPRTPVTAPVATVAAAPAPAPPPAPTPPAPPKAASAEPVTGPGSEVEFLVMDNGIESPARTSSGYKTVPEDLDLLFDAPLPEKPAPSAAGHTVAGAPPKGPAIGRSGKNPAVQVPGELPALESQASHADVEMDIPAGPMLESPAPAQPAPAPQKTQGKSNAMLFGGGVAILAVAGALLAWRPWQSGGTVTEASAQPQPTAPAPQPTPAAPALVGAPAPTPLRATTTTTAAATTKPGSKPGDPAANSDTSSDDPVIAVAPSFKPDLNMPGAVDLGVATSGTKPTGTVTSPTELVRRLVNAERQAQQELNSKLAAASFRNVLSPDHLNSTSGVGSARSAWGAGADAIRAYRGRIARLESAYEDSVLSAQRAQKWSAEEMRAWATRQSLAEPAESSQLADLMFSQVNEGLEILAALSGEYTVKGQVISFKNATSATRYTSIRGWVEQRTSTWTGIPETARPYSVTAILHALGDGFPAAQ